MTPARTVLLAFSLILTVGGGVAMAQSSLTLQMPALPDPVRVVLKPATTALLVFDMVDPVCKSQQKCTGEMVPALVPLLARARKLGVVVGYSTRAPTMSKWLPEVAPLQDDTTIVAYGQDRFFNTDLDGILKAKGITTLVLTGWKINGSVLYTSVGATLRDYTVVVPVDASTAASDYETAIGQFQILNQLSANATNLPLKPKASTLSRADMIDFH
jgi:nicotinamidase-related amidase